MNNDDTPQKGVSIGIPGYTILSELGKGGMATVYLAIQECFGRKVALKVMDPNLLVDNTFGERFLREARIVAGVSHPHIIAVYDVGVHENYHYIAMEYHSGGDLQGRITQGLTPEDAVSIIQQTALALDHAHQKGYIHRDVKPDNILFREDGSAVLTDFGIAKPQVSSQQMTQVGKVVGTPKYMSPEQARGGSIDSRSDIYSLGIVLYEALIGEAPFDGTDPIAIGIKHLKDPVPTLPPHLASFQEVLDTVLEKDAGDRYQSGQEFIEALDDIEFLHTDGLVRPPKGKTISTPSGRSKRVHTSAEGEKAPSKAPWVIASIVAFVVTIMILPPFIVPNNNIVQAIYGLKPQPESNANQPMDVVKKQNIGNKETITQNKTFIKPEPIQTKPPTTKEASSTNLPTPAQDKALVTQAVEPDLSINTTEPLPLEAKTNTVGLTPAPTSTAENFKNTAILLEEDTPEIKPNTQEPTLAQDKTTEAEVKKNDVVETVIETSPVITQLLSEAKVALDNNRLTRPKNDNALEKYNEVLALDANNIQAIKGLNDIATRLVTEAKKARDNNQFSSARQHLKNAESIRPSIANVAEIKSSIDNAEKQEQARKAAKANKAQTFANKFRITGLLRSAEQDILQSKFTLPTQENAYSKYKEVLKIDPNNMEAKQGLVNIKELLPIVAQKAVETQNESAELLVQQLKIINNNKASQLQKKL